MIFLMILSGVLVLLRGGLGAVFATIAVHSLQHGDMVTAAIAGVVTALVLAPPSHDPAVIWKMHQEGWKA